MDDSTMTHVGVFVSSFTLAAFSGLATMLRSDQQMTRTKVVGQVLNSGLMGLGTSLLFYAKFEENLYFLVGVCLVAGISGASTLDFLVSVIRKGGFSINLKNDGKPGDTPQEKS